MTGAAAGGTLLVALFGMILLRVPVAVAMLTTGIVGYAALAGWTPVMGYLKSAAYWRFSSYDLSVVPLFLLMGQLATRAGLSRALFDAASVGFGRLRGGLAMASIGGCAGFGAICGSSLATAAALGRVAMPALRAHGYAGRLATGTLAAGGTLGILIPPSVILVIYALLTEQNIAVMFAAALVPGLIAVAGYLVVIAAVVRARPDLAPAPADRDGEAAPVDVAGVITVAAIFFVVVGGIYFGWFTPTEAAAIGAVATGLAALARGGLGRDGFAACLLETARTTGMIFLILLGADLLNVCLALTQLPADAADWIGRSGVSPYVVLFVLLLVYLVLGCVMDSLSMILLTVPLFVPVITTLDFGLDAGAVAIWFGVLALIVVEVGLITPPVGMNVFVINSLAPDVPLAETFRGVAPFLISDGVRVLLLAAFPAITLWLPGLLL